MFPFLQPLFLAALVLFLYKFLTFFYRLTFHPLAKFPGPRLAATSNLYGAYHDLVRPARYVREFPELHRRYGPVVRIFPNELSVFDIDAYNQIFRIGTKFDKDVGFYDATVVNGSHLNMASLREVKPRKDMFQAYFSKAAITRLEPVLQEKVSLFMHKMQNACRGNKTVDLSYAFRCLTIDIITMYCFQKSFDALHAPEFKDPTIAAFDTLQSGTQFGKYLPWMDRLTFQLVDLLPPGMLKAMSPDLGFVKYLRDTLTTQVLYLKNQPDEINASKPSVFSTMFNPDPKKGQYTPSDQDLYAEAMLMVGAGTDTTAGTLTVGTWHAMKNPSIATRLRSELQEAFPSKGNETEISRLESLPYLQAFIKESLRLFYGAPGRLPRVVPPSGSEVMGEYIPAGTVISSAHYLYHHDERVFPDSHTFNPDRWLSSDMNQVKEMEKHMLSFSRGSRQCLGMNLANAELYLVFAQLFRNLELSIYETTERDMEWVDAHVTFHPGHLKVKVREMEK